jgi:hypothetical protein
MAKAQFQSTEIMRIRFSPFVNSVTGAYIIGTDNCTLNYRPPGGAPAAVAMSWDAGIHLWYYDFAVPAYVQGEWRFKAVSDDVNALPQWKTVIWGDYVDDITLGKTAAVAGAATGTTIDGKVGAPAVTLAADIAAIGTVGSVTALIGVPAVTVSADIAAIGSVGSVTALIGAPEGATLCDDVKFLRKVGTNRWKQDAALKQFIVYDDDALTILFRFNTFDDAGVPAGTRVFERKPTP